MADILKPVRLYIPDCYVDEISPPGRKHPSDWIGAPAGDRYRLEPADANDEDEITIAPGQVLPFSWVQDLDAIDIEVFDDGTYATVGRPDPEANAYWLAGDHDTFAESLAGFIENLRAVDGLEPGTMRVEVSRWSEANEHWRFEVTADGPRFVRVESGHA